jgi:hypothetical protein
MVRNSNGSGVMTSANGKPKRPPAAAPPTAPPELVLGAFSPSSMFRCTDENYRRFFPQDAVWSIRVTELPGITQGKKAVYERIVRWYLWNPNAYPSQTQLAKELGVSERQIRDDEDWLQAQGFVALTEDPEKRRRTWKILWHPLLAKSGTLLPVSAETGSQNGLQKPELAQQKPELGPTKTGTMLPHNPSVTLSNPNDGEVSTSSPSSFVGCSSGEKPPSDDAEEVAEAAYVDEVRRRYQASPVVGQKFKAADRKLAARLFRQGISLDRMLHAILLGSVRKVMSNNNRDRAERIMSLAYFSKLINDPDLENYPAEYWIHVERRLKQWSQSAQNPEAATAEEEHLPPAKWTCFQQQQIRLKAMSAIGAAHLAENFGELVMDATGDASHQDVASYIDSLSEEIASGLINPNAHNLHPSFWILYEIENHFGPAAAIPAASAFSALSEETGT